jgi:hypothetical protein
MTEIQYKRWKIFAKKMAKIVATNKSEPSRKQILQNIDFFFECRMDPNEEWRRVEDWDTTNPNENGRSFCVSDHISDMCEYWIPNYWSSDFPYEDEDEEGYNRAIEKWVGPASACIRAGLDIASQPSAGVVGFTAGDVRKMWSPKPVPNWVKEAWRRDYEDLEFDSIKNKEPVWL